MKVSKYTIVSTLCCVFEHVWLWRKSLQFILLDCYVTQPPFSTHLFQGSRKAAFSSSLPVSCPPAKSLFVGQFKLSSASLPSLWPYYFHLLNTIRFSLQGEEMKKETEDHVALITKKKFIFPHSAGRGMSYSSTAGEVVYLCSGKSAPRARTLYKKRALIK